MKKERTPDKKLIREEERLGRQIADPERSARGQGKKEKRLAHLASFPELNPNPVLEVDSGGTLLYLNPAAKKLFPDLENLGIRHPWFQDWDSLKALLRDDPGGSRTREIRIGPAWYEQMVYGDRREKSLRFYGFDISERKSAEKGLQENELRLKAVVENLPVGVWFADESGKILYGNPAGQKIWQGARYVPPEQFHEYKAWWAETGVCLKPEDWAVTRAVRKGEVSLNEILEIECFDGTRKTINNSAVPLFAGESRLFGVVVLNEDITEQVRIEGELRRSETRFRLLAETAGRLLATAGPQGAVNEMCRDVMAFLDCQAFFNFLADEEAGKLRLNAYAGIPEEEARKIEWLDYGAAVCGCVARDGTRIVAENIGHTPDLRTELIKSYGIQAYACHPLMARDRVIGTLSFGTKTRTSFSAEDLAVMQTVADQIAAAMERILLLKDLRRSRDELELKVRERTRELAKTNRELAEQSRIVRGFVSSTITPIVFMDKNFNFISVNEAYAKCCGRDIASFAGRNHFELYPHPENEAIFRRVVETKTPHQAFAKAFSFPDHPDWGLTYWDWTLTPIEGEDGQVEHLVFSLNDVTERIRAGEAIRESENQLRILSAQLLTAQENERKRVSRELHDGLQQTLTAIKFKVEAFLLGLNRTRMKEKAGMLEPIVSMIQESVKEIRRIQADLRPPMLDDLGVLASLPWLFREFQGVYPDIRIEKHIQAEEGDIPEDLKMVVYRVLQEALNNIGKHSGAKRVAISLGKLENGIELQIHDNGRGFDPQEALAKDQERKGMGLASMKERVESTGGLFALQSRKGEGSSIRASWAL